uniref:Uncharacterized protein n=1 Tax=Oncorhynchus tshawytscha TaxID=74940 RepID=A0AAZ3SET3_ONCTS
FKQKVPYSHQEARKLQKSTFFNVLTKSQAATENFPFCSIDPNESRVPIPDERYDFLCQFHKPVSKVTDLPECGGHSRTGEGSSRWPGPGQCLPVPHQCRRWHLP